MIEFSLSRATNVHRQAMDVTKTSRSLLKGHKPAILWFTGLSGAGKSTIANLVERKLSAMGAHTYSLDGDNIRQGLNKDLGFTDADRVENIRRIGEVAKLFVDAGLIVTASLHLALPRRARHGARPGREGRVLRGLRRYAADDRRAAAIPRASTRRPAPARSATSPASTARTRRRSLRNCVSTRRLRRPRRWPIRSSTTCAQAADHRVGGDQSLDFSI